MASISEKERNHKVDCVMNALEYLTKNKVPSIYQDLKYPHYCSMDISIEICRLKDAKEHRFWTSKVIGNVINNFRRNVTGKIGRTTAKSKSFRGDNHVETVTCYWLLKEEQVDECA